MVSVVRRLIGFLVIYTIANNYFIAIDVKKDLKSIKCGVPQVLFLDPYFSYRISIIYLRFLNSLYQSFLLMIQISLLLDTIEMILLLKSIKKLMTYMHGLKLTKFP